MNLELGDYFANMFNRAAMSQQRSARAALAFERVITHRPFEDAVEQAPFQDGASSEGYEPVRRSRRSVVREGPL